jgi:hypothetical protein
MLEASMGSVHEQLEDLGDRVDGQHATIRRMSSLHETHTRFITSEVLKVRQEGRSQYEGSLGKIERIGDFIDKKIIHMDEELDKVVGLVGQKINAKFGEFSSDFMEAMEIEESWRKDLEAKVAFLEEKLTDSFLRMSDLTNLVVSLQGHVSEVEDAVMEESEDDGGEVASSSSSDLDPVENLVAILSGFAPFHVLSFGCSCSFRTSFPPQLLLCALGLVLTTSASTVSSASSVLALLSIGLVVNISPYLISLSLILSYLILPSYLIIPLFIVWTMVAPATPSHSVLVLSYVPNTSKHGPCAGLCANRLGI